MINYADPRGRLEVLTQFKPYQPNFATMKHAKTDSNQAKPKRDRREWEQERESERGGQVGADISKLVGCYK